MNYKERIDGYYQDMLRSLQELVAIESVEGEAAPGMPFGRECAHALDYCLGLCQKLGFPTGSMDGYVGWCEYGEGEEMVCVLAHLDIVPVGEGWTHPPLSGEIADGKIYGRGTLDDKGPAIACIYALKALADSGVQLNRRIRIIFGINEETGCECVHHYVNNGGELPVCAFTPDGEFPIINGEKGMFSAVFSRSISPSERAITQLKAGSASNVVPASAECTLSFSHNGTNTLSAQGKGAHASTPDEGISALSLLMKKLSEAPLDGDSKALVDFIGYLTADNHGRTLGIYCRDDISGEISSNFGVMSIENGEASISLDIRCPVTIDIESIVPTVMAAMEKGGFTTEKVHTAKSIYTPPEAELVRALQKVYESETGQEATLICLGGGTYAKSIPNCVAFGPIFPGEPMLDHQPDEFISIDNLMKCAKIYCSAMYELAK